MYKDYPKEAHQSVYIRLYYITWNNLAAFIQSEEQH